MVSINTSDDLIQIIRENPDFRATVRRELLTEELLEVPSRLQTLTTTVEGQQAAIGDLQATVGELAANMRDLQATVRELQATVGELTADMRDLQATVRELQATVGELTANMRDLQATVGSLGDTMAEIRGDVLESKLTSKIPPLIAREFDVRRVYPIWSDGLLPAHPRIEEFEKTLEKATDDGKITDDDETRLRVTDLIVRSQRKSDRSTLWFAIEASGVIDYNDIARAKHSADVLKKVHGQDAIPLVFGYQISGRHRELANDLQVPVLLDADDRQ